MDYRFTRAWGRASVVVGTGVFLLALLIGAWLGFSDDGEFQRFSTAARVLAFVTVSLVGLILGGTMIVAGQLVCVLLDQRTLLVRIHETLSGGRVALVLAAALTAGMLAGCATTKLEWDKPGVAAAERERDESACRRAAIGADGGGQLVAPYGIDRETYTRCMEGRGYAVRSTSTRTR